MSYVKSVPLKKLFQYTQDDDEVVLLASTNEQPEDAEQLKNAIGADTVDNVTINAAIEEDQAATRDSLDVSLGAWRGMTKNCFDRLAAVDATPLKILLWGDSMISFSGMAPSPYMGVKGLFMGAQGVYGGGAALVDSAFDHWVNGRYSNVPAGGSVKYPIAGTNDIAGDTISVFFIKEDVALGTNTFDFEYSSNGGSTWTKANGGTPIDATNSGGGRIGAVATYSVSASNNPLYQIRITCVAGTVKVIGGGIYYNNSNADGVVWCSGLMDKTGHDLVDSIQTPSAILTPIITGIDPDLIISYQADNPLQWTEERITLNATLTNGSPNITFDAVDNREIAANCEISGTGIPAGTTVVSVGISGDNAISAVLSQNATATGASTLTVRGAFLTLYDLVKTAVPTCDFLQISPTPADAGLTGTTREDSVEVQSQWAAANGEAFFDGYSPFVNYDYALARGLVGDVSGHHTAAGARLLKALMVQSVPLFNTPLGRIPLLHRYSQEYPHSQTYDTGFSASLNNASTLIAPFTITARGIRVADWNAPSTAANQFAIGAVDGEGQFLMNSTTNVWFGKSSFIGLHPRLNGQMLGGRGSVWWTLGGAGLRLEYRETSDGSPVTIVNTDYVINATGTNDVTVTLPTSVALNSSTTNYTNAGAGAEGRIYVIKNSTAANTVTIATGSSQTIDGSPPGTLSAGQSIKVMSTGSGWITIP